MMTSYFFFGFGARQDLVQFLLPVIAFLSSDNTEYLFMFVSYRKTIVLLIARLNVGNYSQGYDLPRVVFASLLKVLSILNLLFYSADSQLHKCNRQFNTNIISKNSGYNKLLLIVCFCDSKCDILQLLFIR